MASRPPLASRLRDRIIIKRLTNTADGKGGFDRNWATLADNLPAEVTNQGGREALLGSSLQGIMSVRIVVRRRDDLRASDQVIWTDREGNDRELNIKSVGPDPFLPQVATQIFADSEAPQGAGE